MKVEEIKTERATAFDEGVADAGAVGAVGEDAGFVRYRRERVAHWDEVARWMDERRVLGGAYQCRLAEVYRFLVPKGSRVLEVGCARGDLFAARAPSEGLLLRMVIFAARRIKFV